MAKKKNLTKKKKSEIMFSDAYATITSREIAEMTGKRHDNVLADIREVVNELDVTETNQPLKASAGRSQQSRNIFYSHTYQVGGKGKRYPMYVMGEFVADMVITGYSLKYRAAILKELYSRRDNAALWCESRADLRHEHWELTGHIKRLSAPIDEDGNVCRDENGKRLTMRYSTELNMMNSAVLGMQAKKFKQLHAVDNIRDALEVDDLALLDKVQKYNNLMLDKDTGYYARKAEVTELVKVVRKRAGEKLLEMSEE